MEKRIKKKKFNELTEEEQTVIKLFRECESVNFFKHNQSTKEGNNFVSILGPPDVSFYDNSTWFRLEVGKITAAAFLKG